MMDSRVVSEVGVVQRRLLWWVAFSALLVYLVTLQRSATIESIAVLAKCAGWDWHPNLVAPLHVLLTYPIRWLPASVQLLCLNLTAAVSAALALGLLARSVSLLPYDRTRLQRYIENRFGSLTDLRSAWLPPVVAAMVCGFQLSFWENAIVGTGEMLDLLLFAWLVNGLLEFRLDRKESRLPRWAFVYGLAMANNSAMIGFFPAFLVALIWIKGASFFGLRLLATLTASGLMGLLVLLVPPLLHFVGNPDGYGFTEVLLGYFSYQKNSLLSFPRYVVLLCSLTSIFPMLFIGIRWPSHFGEISALGVKLTNYGVHLIHFTLLIACIWVSFDPAFSPRSLVRGMSAMLPFYYLGSLAIGYGIGYLLLVFCAAIIGTEERASRVGWVAANAAVVLVWAAAVAVPVGLVVKNFSLIKTRPPLEMEKLARAAARSFPAEGAVALGDDPYFLYSVQRELLKINPNHSNILVDTSSLSLPAYHYFLQKRHRGRWPGFVNRPSRNVPIDPANLANMILQIREGTPIYYLHPSYGYYFEFLYPKSRQAIYELLPYPTNSLSGPVLTKREIEAQDSYWTSLMGGELRTLLDRRTPVAKGDPTRPPRRDPRKAAMEIASRALNDFGVSVQRSGDLDRAGKYFALAASVNPDNLAAAINRAYNVRLRGGEKAGMEMTEEIGRGLQSLGGRWDRLIGENGPVDEPMSCYRLAQAFSSGNNLRQAGQQLERTLHFSPDNRSARLDYLMMCVRVRLADQALDGIANYRAHFGRAGIKTEEEMELLRVEAWAKVLQNKPAEAEKLLVDAQAKHPSQSLPWETLVEIHLQAGRETNALEVLKRQIEVQPRNVKALVNYGGIKLRAGDYEGALPFLDLALQQKPDDENGLFNRALASSATRRFESASKDFQALLAGGTAAYRLQASFGLAEVYFRMNRREESLRYYREFLKLAGDRAQEANVARERIKILETTKGKIPHQDG